MSSTQRYYLDTSAQIARAGGLTETRVQLKAMLKNGGHATSSQVLREWNRIVFGACAGLRNALAKAEDWTDVVAEMRKGFGGTASRNWQVTHWITASDTTNLAVVEKRAQDFQRIRARVMFNHGVTTIRDGTECEVARRRPERSTRAGEVWRYWPTCKKTEQICEQPQFLRGQLERARAAATALEASNRPNDAKMGKNAMRTLGEDTDEATKGSACHGKNGIGGDICIALECEPEEVLLTTDASFDIICPAIGIEHKRL